VTDTGTCNAAKAMRAEAIAQLNAVDNILRSTHCEDVVYAQIAALNAIGHALVAIDLHLHELIEVTDR